MTKPTTCLCPLYMAQLPGLIAAALVLLLLSGAALAVHYNPWHAFGSLDFIAREVNQGWLVQDYHSTATTMICGAAYLYLFREMLRRGYRGAGRVAWILGVALLALLLAAGWLGFVLRGGAAGAAALQALAGGALAQGGILGALGGVVFGGPVGADTLARLEMFHVLLALALVGVLAGLLAARRPSLLPYAAALAVFALIFSVFAFYLPHLGTPRLDRLPAASGALPLGVALPWYLVPFGAFGAVAPVVFVLLFALPWLDRGGGGRLYTAALWLLGLVLLALIVCPAPLVATLGTLWVFLHLLVLTPLLTALETP
jgi:ubiquinol-cytochrome c reductase cytochrome b subunit